MNKQQPYHIGWELGGAGVLGAGTGDLDLGNFYNEQTTTLPFRLGTRGGWGFRGGDRGLTTMNKQQAFRLGTGGDWGLGLGTYTWRCSTNNNPLGWELGGGWVFRAWDWGLGTYTWRCSK